ncbi:unnamed protein product [Dovyalis caffra]|uniref:Uncharacterized protein n=1 Tax=Dovyalis caffra TaxID=77055 RepID=A0AAV1R761_9ROSI|nr:unnamed protein product [Dovyalis caffra]
MTHEGKNPRKLASSVEYRKKIAATVMGKKDKLMGKMIELQETSFAFILVFHLFLRAKLIQRITED